MLFPVYKQYVSKEYYRPHALQLISTAAALLLAGILVLITPVTSAVVGQRRALLQVVSTTGGYDNVAI
jgi:hypothetical protein